jgi:DNA-binding NtrC family response regulator
LRNAIQRAYVMAEGGVIDEEWLPKVGTGSPVALMDIQTPDHIRPMPSLTTDPAETEEPLLSPKESTLQLPVGISMASAERQLIEATLKDCLYQKERTAAVLGISLKTLYNRLKGYTSPS